jgi:nucleotide-binding universal stress UspA family protein
MVDKPGVSQVVTGRWQEDSGGGLKGLIFHARHHDLVVMARATKSDGLPEDRLEALLMSCGRPVLIASQREPRSLLGNVVICWKETPDAARAVSAALPLLMRAKRVALLIVEEGSEPLHEASDELVRQLAWHGIDADPHVISRDRRPTADVLFSTARAHEADLMVMGGYGHWPVREAMFGGCTQAVLEAAEIPVFLFH